MDIIFILASLLYEVLLILFYCLFNPCPVFIAAYSCSRPVDKVASTHGQMMGLSNGHAPLRHTASYDESYMTSPPLLSAHVSPTPPMMAPCYDNSEYYRHCHEQKYKPPQQPADLSKGHLIFVYLSPEAKAKTEYCSDHLSPELSICNCFYSPLRNVKGTSGCSYF